MQPTERRFFEAGERRAWSQEMRDRCRFVREVVEYLPVAFRHGATKLTPGPNGSQLLRDGRSRNLAQFFEPALGIFIAHALDNLQAFAQYIEHVEQESYESRRELRWMRQRLEAIENELLTADGLGVGTKDGQRRVRAAIATVRDRSRLDV